MTEENLLEHQIHSRTAKQLDCLAPLLKFLWFSVPNEGHRSGRFGARLKSMGMKAGVTDINIVKDGGGYFGIELKTRKGKQSAVQKDWQARCEELHIPYYLCRSVNEVITVLEKEFNRKIEGA